MPWLSHTLLDFVVVGVLNGMASKFMKYLQVRENEGSKGKKL